MRRRTTRVLWLMALLLVSRSAPGQPEPSEELVPPSLLRGASAHPDPNALPEQQTVAVLLELLIDDQGRVTNARVVESAGSELDGAALEAVRDFEFLPARRNGKPVSVKIGYRFVFQPRTAESPPPVPLPPTAPKSKPSETLAPADRLEAKPAGALPEYEATAEVEAPTRSVTQRSFEAAELSRVAGVRGDAIRAVDVMPGVTPSAAFDGETPSVRGADWFESQVFLGGTPVPLLFHFGGITSFFQSRLLERVELLPGNFSVRYGRVTGAIIDARVREPRRDRWHGMVDLSVIDSAAMVEAPIGDASGVALAARRSNVDFFFEQLVPEDAYSVVAAPVYYDYQALASSRIGDQRVSLMGYGSRDSIDLLFSDPNDSEPTLRGAVGGSVEFHHLNLRVAGQASRELRHATSLTLGLQKIEAHLGPLNQALTAVELYGRSSLELGAAPELGLALGVDFFGQLADGRYSGPRPGGFDSDPTDEESPALEDTIDVARDDIRIIAPAFWLELSLRPTADILITPGVRLDYYEFIDAWTVDPRLAVRHSLTPSTTLNTGVGLFSQAPQWYEALVGAGNPELLPYHAAHFGAGVEQRFGRRFEVGIDAFYKRIFDRVVSSEGSRPPYLVNHGQGRIFGTELSASLRPTPHSFGYLAYTLSLSERRDRNDPWTLFENDRTHVLSAVASQRFSGGFELSARFRFASGRPMTPIVASIYDARIDLYRPIYGAINSERDGAFHQLDVRFEKRWRISELTLAAYVEVLNLYNAKNPEGKSYSYDYSKQESVSGLPILPNIGVRGEL